MLKKTKDKDNYKNKPIDKPNLIGNYKKLNNVDKKKQLGPKLKDNVL